MAGISGGFDSETADIFVLLDPTTAKDFLEANSGNAKIDEVWLFYSWPWFFLHALLSLGCAGHRRQDAGKA